MARSFGKTFISIWNDPDFISLSCSAQRLYLFLSSQGDLTMVGTLTMALNRWASRVKDQSRDDLLEALHELSTARFVVVDEQCEELLVRSFMRRDEGWKSPNMMKGIRGEASAVMSETLRAVILEEADRIDTSGLPTRINERTGRSTKDVIESILGEMKADLEDCQKDDAVLNWNPFLNVLEGFPDTKNNPLGKGSRMGSLTTTTTTTAIATAIATTTAEKTRFDDFYEIYPRKAKRRDALKAWEQALDRGINPQTMIEGAKRFAADPNLPTGDDRRFIPLPATWIRADCWDDEPLPPRYPTRNGGTDDRVAGWMNLANELEPTSQLAIGGTAS